jgi:predicted Zn-dependent protease
MPPPNVLPRKASAGRTASRPVLSTTERLDVAKRDFRVGHHNSALAHASMLLQEMPNNANLLQFRSLVYFRKGDYKRSALDAYEAVKHGGIWSEATVKDLYAYPAFYQRELRLLRLDESTDLTTAFLSAYHHLVAGELDHGRESLKQVLTIKPGDPIATALIHLVDTRQGSKTTNQLAQAGH